LQLWDSLVVAVDREGAAEEERKDAGTEELVFGDRPIGVAKLRAGFGW
jgi:hypothetical protein